MKRTVKRIASLQAGKMLGVLYACMGLIFLPILCWLRRHARSRNMRREPKLLHLRRAQL
jgi:hypothetical protein